jgi:centromere protein C
VTARERSPGEVVARRLDFSKSSQQLKKPLTNGRVQTNGIKSRNEKPTKGHSPVQQPTHSDGTEEEEQEEEDDNDEEDEEDEPLELLNEGDSEQEEPPEVSEQEEMEEEVSLVPELKSKDKPKPPGRRGRKPKATVEKEKDSNAPEDASLVSASTEENEADEEPAKRRKGRRLKTAVIQEKEPAPVADPTPPPKSSKRGRPARTSTDGVEESSAESRGAKRQKAASKPVTAEEDTSPKPVPIKGNGKPGRKRKSSGVGVDSPAIQRGPPLPRSRGLVTLRREDTTAMRTTRSGRASFKPLEWWKGEHVEYDEEQEEIFKDAGNRHFKMPTVKGVVRTEASQDELARKRRGRPPVGRKPSRRPSTVAEEEEIEREEWEDDPGRVTGEVICWEPEHEFEPPAEDDEVEVIPDELAISENAIQLKDIKDATFKFAKTLTLPFFGSGIVDLPPGAEKRPKNSRKMHLVFFVHTGSVQVTIAQTEFGIAKGGMFFVPRGTLMVKSRMCFVLWALANGMMIRKPLQHSQ